MAYNVLSVLRQCLTANPDLGNLEVTATSRHLNTSIPRSRHALNPRLPYANLNHCAGSRDVLSSTASQDSKLITCWLSYHPSAGTEYQYFVTRSLYWRRFFSFATSLFAIVIDICLRLPGHTIIVITITWQLFDDKVETYYLSWQLHLVVHSQQPRSDYYCRRRRSPCSILLLPRQYYWAQPQYSAYDNCISINNRRYLVTLFTTVNLLSPSTVSIYCGNLIQPLLLHQISLK